MTPDINTTSGAADLLSLIDSYAEARHVGGCHTYNARTAAARNAVVAALESATPQADSQPAPVREGEWINDAGRIKWLMWRVQDLEAKLAARAPADSVTASAGEVDDDVDAIALARYKVVPAHESMFHRFAVVAGGGKQQLYLGREVECENMARKFAGAFLDGAFYQSNIAPAQTADSVLEDAARLERERICAAIKAEDDYCVEHGDYMLDSDDCIKIARSEWVRPDYLVDAARKQGANHD